MVCANNIHDGSYMLRFMSLAFLWKACKCAQHLANQTRGITPTTGSSWVSQLFRVRRGLCNPDGSERVVPGWNQLQKGTLHIVFQPQFGSGNYYRLYSNYSANAQL